MIEAHDQKCCACGNQFQSGYVCEKCGRPVCAHCACLDADSPLGVCGYVCPACPGAHVFVEDQLSCFDVNDNMYWKP
jgi:hypothetical protein